MIKILIPLSITVLLLCNCSGPAPTDIEYKEIDTSLEPVQAPYHSNEIISLEIKNGIFSIEPKATYKISAMVVSKENYNFGWTADIAPIDVALAWGKLTDPVYDKYITYSQRDRWYFYENKPESPFSVPYIISHSANNHIIPASENIRKAVASTKEKQKVVLEGFLVNVTGTYKKQKIWWNSSLSRIDTGEHSCELFYVTRARIGDYVYQ